MRINTTLCSTLGWSEEEYQKGYAEQSEEYKEEFEMQDFVNEMIEQEQSDFFENLRYSGINDIPCVVLGSLGLWTGRKTIYPTKCQSIDEAIYKCLGRDTCNYVIKQVNGHLELEVYHHDGTNYLNIYLLNEKGQYTENGDLSNKRYHQAIKGHLF